MAFVSCVVRCFSHDRGLRALADDHKALSVFRRQPVWYVYIVADQDISGSSEVVGIEFIFWHAFGTRVEKSI
jgi:hypothetical protein